MTPDELEIVVQCDLPESRIQQNCNRIFSYWTQNLELEGLFVHIDNGGKSGIAHKVKKKFEGVIYGFPDVMLLVSNKEGKKYECFIEFKRISSPSAVKPKDNQLETHTTLRELGYDVFVINNAIYFEKVILENIKNKKLG
ncbi:MAG: VRR-NUC domain-containing protein [Candidatus Lokiarchaeota archaeon]|nr:VRR-NUC domain-containing protein [Candidatus Lokiarchaeota archaeon]